MTSIPGPRVALLAVAVCIGCGTRGGAPDAGAGPTGSAASTESPSASAAASAQPSASADVVANASTEAEPAGPSVLGSGSVDGAALRKRHIERLKKDTSPVTLLKGESPRDLGKAICEAVVPRRAKDTPILLKPNLCGFDSIKDPAKSKGDDGVTGRGTNAEFTRGVIQCLKARGHTKITVAEGCGVSHKFWKQVAAVTGYETMTREEGVSLVAMDDDGVFDVEGDQPGKPLKITGIGATHVPTLLMPKILAEVLDHGLFISLPKVKAHRYAVVSIAVKGMQGTVMLSDQFPAYKQKFRTHKELGEYLDQRKDKSAPEDRKLYIDTLHAFAERMVDVLEISTPDVVLADGAPGMGGDGFQQLYPTAEKFAIGGTNPVLVDKVGAEMLGLWNNARLGSELGGHKTSPLIDAAAKRFKLDLAATKVVGDGADLLKEKRPVHFKAMAPFAIHSDSSQPWVPSVASLPEPTPDLKPTSAPAVDTAPKQEPAPSAPPVVPPAPGPAETSGGKPALHAAHLTGPEIVLDGRPDDPAWATAPAATWSTDYAGKTTPTSTRVRFVWSKGALFALFELSGAGLHVDASKPKDVERERLYEEDCVEIFFTPDAASPKHYYEVELGPFGHFFDLDVHLGGKTDTSWSSGVKVGTTRAPGAKEAVIEASFSAPAITGALAPGARLPLGLYRMEGTAPRQYLAWSPPRTAKPNFHVPEAFGALVIDP